MEKTWGNTLLVAYSSIEKFWSKTEKQIENRINRGFQSKHFHDGESTFDFLDGLQKLTDEKRVLCNAKSVVEEALKRMRTEDAEILTLRVIYKRTFQRISQDKGIALRTVFRRFDRAENSFANALHALGYDEETLERNFKGDCYVQPIYDRISEEIYSISKNM